MTSVYIDGDACPVKDEIYRAAARRDVKVFVVANTYIRTPPVVESVVVDASSEIADDYIAAKACKGDMVVTADIELASRCLKNAVACIGHKGKRFTEDNIGSALAMRDLMKHVRQTTGREIGPKPFSQRDRRNFMREFSRLLDTLLA